MIDESDVPQSRFVAAYLRATDWEYVEKHAGWSRFRKRIEEDEVVLEVPMLDYAPDYPRRFLQLCDDLRRIERRPIDALIRDIRSSTSDVIRIRVQGNITNGRIPVEQGARVFQRTRDLLLAAACASVEKRPVYSRRKPQLATDYLTRAQFAPTEAGSFVFVVESMVPPQLEPVQPDLPDDQPRSLEEEPFDRCVGLTLARSTAAARRIIDDISATGSQGPVVEGVSDGVSSNLCDALAGLVDPDFKQTLEMRFQWAATRPPQQEVPHYVVFDSAVAPYLKEMGRTLREQSNIAEFDLVGPILRLTGPSPTASGEITVVHMGHPLRGRTVRVQLSGPAYQDAVKAHGAESWIAVDGDLTRERGALVLMNPRNLRIHRVGVEPEDSELG